jgi:hypothetical protein
VSSHNKGKRRTKSDAHLQAGKLTALLTVAALTVAAGSAGSTSAVRDPNSDPSMSNPSIVATSATNTGAPAPLFRNTGLFTSRSQHRVGLPPQNLVEVTPTASAPDGFDGPDKWQRQQDLRVARAKAIAEVARLGKVAKAKVAKAKAAAARVAAAKAAKAAKAARASRAEKDARKARAVAAQIEAVEAAMDAERARVALFKRTHPRPSTAATEAVKAWAAVELTRMGYEPEQFICLDLLWTRESGWNPFADNPTSTAYGIPQSLPGTKMASAGADWRTNPRTQITWGLGYIRARYENPCRAWAHSESGNWY